MKKKLLSLALVLAMALTLLPTAAFAADGCNHTNAEADGVASTMTQHAATTGTLDCTKITYLQACYSCSVCKKYFSNYESAATAETNVISDTSTYVVEAKSAHSWKTENPDGSCTNAIGNSTCGVTCDHSAGYAEDHTCKTCGTVHASGTDHNYGSGTTCTICGAANPDAPQPAQISGAKFEIDGTDATKGTLSWTYTAASDAAEGSTPTFTITCPTNPAGISAAAAQAGSNNSYTSAVTLPADLADGTYTFTIADNSTPPVTATATYNKGASGPAEPVTITSVSAQYDGATLTVTWKLSAPLAQAVKFNVKVDSDAITDKDAFTFTTDAMGTSVDCSFTKQVSIPDGTHTVIIRASGVSGSGQASFTVSTAPSTPAEPSDGIPNPGSVTTPAAAESAIKNIQSAGADKIAAEIEKELADTSSDASTTTIDKLEKLETAVMDQANIKVSVSPDSKVPEALNTKKVSIIGAALNAEKTSNTKVELKISAPKTERTLGRNYDNDVAVQFSMTLTNVVNAKKLAVPVIITVPLPAGISSSKAVVLHYAGTDSASQVLQSKVSGGYISFAATGFSDFIITQRVERKTSSGGGGGGGTKVTNIPVTVTPTVPSAPAGIFTDVPAGHSFASQITWARDNGVMGGYADGSFRPANPTNRQQLWMVLARLSGAAPADMAAAREWAVNSGVSDGANGEGTLSRQQLVTMLYRYAQSQEMNLEGAADLAAYPDNAAVASYAQEALAWAVGKGIVTGTSDGRLNPEGTATRGQFAVIMYRFSHQG